MGRRGFRINLFGSASNSRVIIRALALSTSLAVLGIIIATAAIGDEEVAQDSLLMPSTKSGIFLRPESLATIPGYDPTKRPALGLTPLSDNPFFGLASKENFKARNQSEGEDTPR